MRGSQDFIKRLKEIEKEGTIEEYQIHLDHDIIHIVKKDDDSGDSESFRTSPYNVLWELLEERGFDVEEG